MVKGAGWLEKGAPFRESDLTVGDRGKPRGEGDETCLETPKVGLWASLCGERDDRETGREDDEAAAPD